MFLEYSKTHGGARPPSRSNPSDAGADLFYCPKEAIVITVDPSRSVVLPTGLRFGIPHGYMLEIKNRSGIAAKRSLIVGACVVDAGYDGEVFVNIHNIGGVQQRIFPHDKIAQAVLTPVAHPRFIEREDGSLYDDDICISDRGDGALGSTGDK